MSALSASSLDFSDAEIESGESPTEQSSPTSIVARSHSSASRDQASNTGKRDALLTQQTNAKTATKYVEVPNFIKNLLHSGYKEAVGGQHPEWNVEKGKSLDSEENKSSNEFVRDYVRGIAKNVGDDVLHAGLKRYFQTKR
eukprot:Seg7722.1 transcript_id=Seg7722.1/GoldUCD/mRNA.D3Y31 product="hypothetical protein" protein_id=Seg7722.1/GoldUCD/D3Y31